MKGILYFDGASKGNPGEAGIGFVIEDESGRRLAEGFRHIGVATNNVAEYTALIEGLEKVLSVGITEIEVRSDSELVVLQVKGEYRVKSKRLLPLYRKVLTLLSRFRSFTIVHVGREKNREADRLANRAIRLHRA